MLPEQPAGEQVPENLLFLFADQEDVTNPLFKPVQSSLQPLVGKLKVDRGGAWLGELVVDDQLILLDGDGLLVKDFFGGFGPADRDRLVFHLLVRTQ